MPSVAVINPARLSVVTRDFTTSPTLGALLAMPNPYLSLFKKVVKFSVVIVERLKVMFPKKLNQNGLFVVGPPSMGIKDESHNVRLSIMTINKDNNVACLQIANLTLNSHT
jgi:hypothetical protein